MGLDIAIHRSVQFQNTFISELHSCIERCVLSIVLRYIYIVASSLGFAFSSLSD